MFEPIKLSGVTPYFLIDIQDKRLYPLMVQEYSCAIGGGDLDNLADVLTESLFSGSPIPICSICLRRCIGGFALSGHPIDFKGAN